MLSLTLLLPLLLLLLEAMAASLLGVLRTLVLVVSMPFVSLPPLPPVLRIGAAPVLSVLLVQLLAAPRLVLLWAALLHWPLVPLLHLHLHRWDGGCVMCQQQQVPGASHPPQLKGGQQERALSSLLMALLLLVLLLLLLPLLPALFSLPPLPPLLQLRLAPLLLLLLLAPAAALLGPQVPILLVAPFPPPLAAPAAPLEIPAHQSRQNWMVPRPPPLHMLLGALQHRLLLPPLWPCCQLAACCRPHHLPRASSCLCLLLASPSCACAQPFSGADTPMLSQEGRRWRWRRGRSWERAPCLGWARGYPGAAASGVSGPHQHG